MVRSLAAASLLAACATSAQNQAVPERVPVTDPRIIASIRAAEAAGHPDFAYTDAEAMIERRGYPSKERAHPRGFERCISGPPRHAEVRLRYDVTATGRTDGIEIIASTDECFDRFAKRAVQRWRYDPAVVDGEAVRLTGVETSLTFEIERISS